MGKHIERKTVLPVLLGCALRGQPIPESVLPADWAPVLAQAERHKVLSTLACAVPLMEQKPSEEICKQLEAALLQQMLVSSNQLHAAQQLQEAFEQRGLYNLALKGIHTKLRYPQDYMRTMGDLDVLSRAEQNGEVKKAMQALGYSGFQEGRKHDHYTGQPFITVEMHREAVSASSRFSPYYEHIWQRCQPLPGCSYSFVMPVEEEYLYNLIHMVEHFKEGGVGIRFLMDVYVYESLVELDRPYLLAELEKLELTAFYRNIVRLALYWFGDGQPDGLTQQLEEFVLSGGVYGSLENARAISVARGGRLAFLLRTCFPGLKEMRSMFPWLKKWPVALPFAWVLRAVRSLLFRRKNIKAQLDTYANADAERGQQLREFYRACGLEEL